MFSPCHDRTRASYLTLLSAALFLLLNVDKAAGIPRSWPTVPTQHLSDSNTKISFEVDSTWHLVKGRTSGIVGELWSGRSERRELLPIKAKLEIPVAQFDTDGESRDKRMREVMDSEHSPKVILHVDSIMPKCSAEVFYGGESCEILIATRLIIRGREKPMNFRGDLLKIDGRAALTGEVSFSWADFGVEDPSILIAKLDPLVKILFSVSIPLS